MRRHRLQRDHLPESHGATDAGHCGPAHVPIRAAHQGMQLAQTASVQNISYEVFFTP